MKTSQKGIDLIKQFEGCHLTAYKCPTGKLTIGYGHTAGVKEGQKITQAQADAYLKADLEKFEKHVDTYNNKYKWNQNEFDALVSFAFNIGNIDQLTAKGTRSRAVIAEKILLYNKDGEGKVLTGLTKRRQAEQKMFLNAGDAVEQARSTVKSGSTGEDVRYLQTRLYERGYNVGTIDGKFGSRTLAAVKLLQQDYGLTADGVVGAKTWAAIEDAADIKILSLVTNGNNSLSANFKVKEFACKDKSDKILLDVEFVQKYLQKIRDHFGASVTINSGYRTLEYNTKIGGAANSYHCRGRAFDIVVKGHTPAEVARYAQTLGILGIIQYNGFVHVDSRKTRYWALDNNGKVAVKNNF